MTQLTDPPTQITKTAPKQRGLEAFALRFANWMERWFPDTFAIVLVAVLVVGAGALAIGASPAEVSQSFGDGFWNLLPFSMQMALVVVTGYALATSTPVRRIIERIAVIPSTPRGAVAMVAFAATATSLLNWGFGLIFAGLLVRALGRRTDLEVDYRAASAAGYLSVGGPAMLGLSSSAALLHATPASVPPELLAITGLIPLAETLFTWQNLVMILVMTSSAVLIAWATAPRGDRARTARDLGVDLDDTVEADDEVRPGDRLGRSPVLTVLIGAVMLGWIWTTIHKVGVFHAISNLNNYLFIVLSLAFLLHGRPIRFVKAMTKAVPSVSGVIIQFPFYAGVAAILVTATNGEGKALSHYLSDFFIQLGGHAGLPLIVGIYSVVMGILVPSAGAKWVLEAPYIMGAAGDVHSNMAWLIETYSGAEALANLINPFWMLPLLGIVMLKARQIVGFTFIYFIFLAPITVLTFWALSFTFSYAPPVMP
ncbi:short-chain fatty acid transporter [Antrihabitans cavernicola]|uniref:Short-chain fatty acid transporter n=1 Tax=Antrihabitans cavernicola TaxID=2495913 RepID=A0A5A7SJS6_9NOCA|nr:TIGR00366 family protein [Spelaeibacter cavernicola]KAA0024903.1 short-chain fatty acid transporter [Spelaeibacter cavernicola]